MTINLFFNNWQSASENMSPLDTLTTRLSNVDTIKAMQKATTFFNLPENNAWAAVNDKKELEVWLTDGGKITVPLSQCTGNLYPFS